MDTTENDSATLERLLAELTALRHRIGVLAETDIAQLKDTVAELSQIHPNPLVAIGICLGRQQPNNKTSHETMEALSHSCAPTLSAALTDDFIDNSGDY